MDATQIRLFSDEKVREFLPDCFYFSVKFETRSSATEVRAEMGCKIFVEKAGTVFLKNGKSTIPQNVECWSWVPV